MPKLHIQSAIVFMDHEWMISVLIGLLIYDMQTNAPKRNTACVRNVYILINKILHALPQNMVWNNRNVLKFSDTLRD